MIKLNSAVKGAIIAGVVGLFFATVGFWRTLMIAFLVVLGYLIGTFIETREKEKGE
jgi:uncharacterized membrane protein